MLSVRFTEIGSDFVPQKKPNPLWGGDGKPLVSCLRDSRVAWDMRSFSYHLPFCPAFVATSKRCICVFSPPSPILSHLTLQFLTTGTIQKAPYNAFIGSKYQKSLSNYNKSRGGNAKNAPIKPYDSQSYTFDIFITEQKKYFAEKNNIDSTRQLTVSFKVDNKRGFHLATGISGLSGEGWRERWW